MEITDSELKMWLESTLKALNFDDFSYDVVGNSEQGDGYASDVIFVHVKGTKKQVKEELHLALKCAKRSPSRGTVIKEAFQNEIALFEKIIPGLVKFQKEKGLNELISDLVPQYFGKYVDDNIEVIIMQNLKKMGFNLNKASKNLTRAHIDLVVKAYANLHATSIAFQDQNRAEFDKLAKSLTDDNLYAKALTETNLLPMFKSYIKEVCENLRDKVDTTVFNQYKSLENQVEFIIRDMFKQRKITTFVHGDSWNNNFMFLVNQSDKPLKVAILDWQLVGLSSPIRDLSYFLLACISDEVVNDLDEIIASYYEFLADYMKKLGSDPEVLYPRGFFNEEWKKFAKFGVLLGGMIIKVCTSNKEEISRLEEALEKGSNFAEAMKRDDIGDSQYVKRSKLLVEYAAKSGLLKE